MNKDFIVDQLKKQMKKLQDRMQAEKVGKVVESRTALPEFQDFPLSLLPKLWNFPW
jgi:hypothetical protein